ncbi:MAG: hypothetical protein ACLVJH_15925 [Faecalibacterium prausnitzii]
MVMKTSTFPFPEGAEGRDPHHHRRHHPAGRGRQGRCGGDYDRRGDTCSSTRSSPRHALQSASPRTRRSARVPTIFDVEGFGADFAYTVDGGELGEHRVRELQRRPTPGVYYPRREHPPRLGQGQDDQRASDLPWSSTRMLPVTADPAPHRGL